MALDFGKFKEKVEGDDDKNSSDGITSTSKSVQRSTTPRINYKRKYEDLKTEHDVVAEDYERVIENRDALLVRINELEGPLADEIDMLRQQEGQQKRAIDILTKDLEKFKFRPQDYSEIAQILNCLHVNANKPQQETLDDLIGSHIIRDVRKRIFTLLERPYDE